MKNTLYILWTNADPITSEKMVCMYAQNALKYKWWDEITVIVWGAPAKLLADNKILQKRIKEIIDSGVKVSACKACADELGVSQEIAKLGIEIKYWGEGLTEIIKSDTKLITI